MPSLPARSHRAASVRLGEARARYRHQSQRGRRARTRPGPTHPCAARSRGPAGPCGSRRPGWRPATACGTARQARRSGAGGHRCRAAGGRGHARQARQHHPDRRPAPPPAAPPPPPPAGKGTTPLPVVPGVPQKVIAALYPLLASGRTSAAAAGLALGVSKTVALRCPGVSGQGSNRIFAGKDGGSNGGEQES